jgi:TRAP-type C4-dicarboxylate transport system permease small subunit
MADEKKPDEKKEEKPAAKAKADEPKAKAKADEKPKADDKPKTDDKPKADDQPKAAKTAPPDAEIPKAAWAEPLVRFDRAWTKLESRLAAGVLLAEIATLIFWIAIRALSSTGESGSGQLFRRMLVAAIFGGIAWRFTKKHPQGQTITTGAVIAGVVAGSYGGEHGTVYFSNLFAWLQNSSILVFFGGASDLAKRFTLWLALLGASLATAQGKHINVDVVMRFLSPKMRVPIAVIGWVAAAVVAISASWGFFDFVAVEELKAPTDMPCPGGDATKICDATPMSKVDAVEAAFGRDLFLTGRQLSLDLRTFPKVITGTTYNQTLKNEDWNEWLHDGGWESHFKPEDVKIFEVPPNPDQPYRIPAVTAIPGSNDQINRVLVPLVDLVFAFGLFIVGIRFLLRSLMAIGGHIKVDPNAAHGDDELAHAHDASEQAAAVDAASEEVHS